MFIHFQNHDHVCETTHLCICTKSLQLYLTLCDPMDCRLPGYSVHGIFQARILDWVSIPTSRASYWPRDLTLLSYISCIGRWVLYHYHHLGSPRLYIYLTNACIWIMHKGNAFSCWKYRSDISQKLCYYTTYILPRS